MGLKQISEREGEVEAGIRLRLRLTGIGMKRA
jgi:hypothetical protein